MASQQSENRRSQTRVDFKTQILLKVGGLEYRIEGSSKDLSLKGIFINTQEDIPVGANCQVEVVLTGMTEPVTLSMEGTVARKTEAGIGVSFDSVGLESFTHLRNIVMYNSENPDDIL